MKQKYVMPTIEIVGSLLENTILAESNGNGGGSGGLGSDSETEIKNPGGSSSGTGKPPFPGGSSSKEHNFNAWETWDEY